MYLINRETQGAFQRWDSWGSFSPAQLVWAGSQGTGLLALLRSLPTLAIPGQQAHLATSTYLRGRAGARAQSLFCTPTMMEQGGSD